MAVKTGLFGMGAAGTAAAAVATVAVLGVAGREIYLRGPFAAPDPAVAVVPPADPVDPPATLSAVDPADAPSPPTDPDPIPVAAPAPDAAPDPAPEVDPAPEAEPTAAPEPVPLAAPSFDVVRVDPDGSALIAGGGPVGSQVTLFLDDAKIDSTSPDDSGKFAIFAFFDPAPQPRLLTLMARRDGQEVWSDDQIILAPIAQPVPAPDVIAQDPAADAPTQSDSVADAAPAPAPLALSEVPVAQNVPEVETPTAKVEAEAQISPQPDADIAEVSPEDPPTSDALDAAPEPSDAAGSELAAAVVPPLDAETPAAVSDAPLNEAATAMAPADLTTEPLTDPSTDPASDAPTVGSAPQTPDPDSVPVAMAQDPAEPAPPAPKLAEPRTPDAEAPTIAAADPTSPAKAAPAGHAPGADPASAPRPDPVAAPAIPDAPAAPAAPTADSRDFAAAPATPTPGTVAVLRAGADGVELLQPGTPVRPDALDRLALDTISYSNSGEVLLAGRAPDGSAVRVYLDNEAVADLAIGSDGRWKGEVPGIRPGLYTLRLDQVAADGAVGGRLETPFKREAPSVLNAATGDQPPNSPGIAAVTVQQGDTLWAISQDRYGSGVLYVRVFDANRDAIRDPDLIYPGQVFTIPN